MTRQICKEIDWSITNELDVACVLIFPFSGCNVADYAKTKSKFQEHHWELTVMSGIYWAVSNRTPEAPHLDTCYYFSKLPLTLLDVLQLSICKQNFKVCRCFCRKFGPVCLQWAVSITWGDVSFSILKIATAETAEGRSGETVLPSLLGPVMMMTISRTHVFSVALARVTLLLSVVWWPTATWQKPSLFVH